MLRIKSPLGDEVESIVTRVIGCCVEVHTALGPGLLEDVYARAVAIELDQAEIKYERERKVPIFYSGRLVAEHRLDVVVEDQIVLELKAVERLAPVHRAQILSYLRASKLRLGLLINFNVPVLGEGIRRVVL